MSTAKSKKRERDPRAVARGLQIKEARLTKGYSQQQVATALGLKSREAVSQWERGDVQEIEPRYRTGLCKVLGFEEFELLLNPDDARSEFEMPISRDAKSIAQRWDDLPESLRVYIKQRISAAESVLRSNPALAKHMFPEIPEPPHKKK